MNVPVLGFNSPSPYFSVTFFINDFSYLFLKLLGQVLYQNKLIHLRYLVVNLLEHFVVSKVPNYRLVQILVFEQFQLVFSNFYAKISDSISILYRNRGIKAPVHVRAKVGGGYNPCTSPPLWIPS